MDFMRRKLELNLILGAVLLLFFVLSSMLRSLRPTDPLLHAIRNNAFIGMQVFLIGIWGVNCWRRILQHRIRYLVILLVVLCLLYITFRALKWYIFFRCSEMERLMWYFFYIPMLFIPYVVLLISASIGREEHEALPRRFKLLVAIPLALLILVLTNDFHELIFTIAEDYYETGNYSYSIFYTPVILWIYGMSVYVVIRLMVSAKQRLSKRSHKFFVTIAIVVATYGVAYLGDYKPIKDGLDITTFYVALTCIVIELMIYYGMIPTNVDYEWSFHNASMNIQVLNRYGNPVYLSKGATPVDRDTLLELMQNDKELLKENEILYLHDLRGGYVVWSEETAEINSAMEETREINEKLAEANDELAKNILIAAEESRLTEGNYLFAGCVRDSAGVLHYIKKLLIKARTATYDERRELLGLINVFGVYIKRRSNLVILNEQPSDTAGGEFRLCIAEMADCLKTFGVDVVESVRELPGFTIEQAILVYDFIEALLYEYLPGIRHIFLLALRKDDQFIFTVEIEGKEELSEVELNKKLMARILVASGKTESEADEETVAVSLRLPVKGGAQA